MHQYSTSADDPTKAFAGPHGGDGLGAEEGSGGGAVRAESWADMEVKLYHRSALIFALALALTLDVTLALILALILIFALAL